MKGKIKCITLLLLSFCFIHFLWNKECTAILLFSRRTWEKIKRKIKCLILCWVTGLSLFWCVFVNFKGSVSLILWHLVARLHIATAKSLALPPYGGHYTWGKNAKRLFLDSMFGLSVLGYFKKKHDSATLWTATEEDPLPLYTRTKHNDSYAAFQSKR